MEKHMTLEQVRDELREIADDAALEGNAYPIISAAAAEQMADAIDAHLRERESAKEAVTDEPYCYTVEQKNGLSQGAMCRTKAECETSPTFDPNNDHIIPLYQAPMLASARVPNKTQLDAWTIMRNLRRWSRMLAAAPKPETEE